MFARYKLLSGVFALGMALLVQGGQAAEKSIWPQVVQPAPQILGLMATLVPQPLVCRGDECTADLASYCLQPDRGEPWPGHPYEAALGSNVTLVGQSSDGSDVRIDATAYARFTANVAMTAVRVSVDRKVLDDLGVSQLALQVGARVSLLPVPQAGDPRPQSQAEIAQATGVSRDMGVEFFEDGGPVGMTARVNAALLTQTPKNDRLTSGERRRLWDQAIGADLKAAASPEGLQQSRRTYEACLEAMDSGITFSMRDCIERRHGGMVRKRSRELGNTLRTGW